MPDGIITPVSSIHIRHFDLAEDVPVTEGVGRGGQGDLGEEGEAMKSEEESQEVDIGSFHDFFLFAHGVKCRFCNDMALCVMR